MKYARVKQGKVPPVCLALMVLFFWLVSCSAQAMAGEYAVQIAAVRSQACAEDLRGGLYARGLDPYWVRIVLPDHGLFYRVRLGKFPSIETAYSYAESMLDSGLLESYAITTYENPNSVSLRDTTQASLEMQEYVQQRPTSRDTNELLAAIGSRQWWLPGIGKLFAATPQFPPVNIGMTQREVLVYALSRHEWRLSQDLSVLFVRAPVMASSTDVVMNAATQKFEAAPSPVKTAVNANAAPVAVPASVEKVEKAFAPTMANRPMTPPPAPGATASSAPMTATANSVSPPASNKAFSDSRTSSPEIGRGGKTTAPRSIGYGKIAPPRLQASAELRNGQLVMRIRNLDSDRPFAGTARVTISDDRKSNDLAPMKFDVQPENEILVPINESVVAGNDWMLMVYDEGGALRMIRGQTIGQKPSAPAQQQARNNQQPGQFELNPPAYVTPVFDATNSNGQIPPTGTVPMTGNSNSSNPLGNNQSSGQSNGADTGSSATPNDPNAPAQLTVTPRLIATTTENVTMEFDIASPQPLQYISVTLAAGEYRDTRQALMSTTRGRVPFLVPATHAQGAFLFEIKDESGRTLAGGAGDFRQMTGK